MTGRAQLSSTTRNIANPAILFVARSSARLRTRCAPGGHRARAHDWPRPRWCGTCFQAPGVPSTAPRDLK